MGCIGGHARALEPVAPQRCSPLPARVPALAAKGYRALRHPTALGSDARAILTGGGRHV